MMRTQIQLPEADYDHLRQVAQRLNRSIADCIREGIKLMVEAAEAPGESLASIAGKFTPQSTADLKPHDRAWAEAATKRRAKE